MAKGSGRGTRQVTLRNPSGPPKALENTREKFGLTAHPRALNNACLASQPFEKEAASKNALRYFEKGHPNFGTTDRGLAWRTVFGMHSKIEGVKNELSKFAPSRFEVPVLKRFWVLAGFKGSGWIWI
jgi:hypothetical protein